MYKFNQSVETFYKYFCSIMFVYYSTHLIPKFRKWRLHVVLCCHVIWFRISQRLPRKMINNKYLLRGKTLWFSLNYVYDKYMYQNKYVQEISCNFSIFDWCILFLTGIGMDASVTPLRHGGLSLVQTTDFFYPLVDDPYMMVCGGRGKQQFIYD